jgi:hypothetical protein
MPLMGGCRGVAVSWDRSCRAGQPEPRRNPSGGQHLISRSVSEDAAVDGYHTVTCAARPAQLVHRAADRHPGVGQLPQRPHQCGHAGGGAGHPPTHPALGPDQLLIAAKVGISPDDDGADISATIDAAEARIRQAVPAAQVIYLEPDIYRPQVPAT